MVSLNARNAKLLPLSNFRKKQEFFERLSSKSFLQQENKYDDEEEQNVGYYDIKIHNENMETIEHTVFETYKKSHSYMSIPFDVNGKTKLLDNPISSESSSSILCSTSSYSRNKSQESLNTSILSSSPESASSLSSIASLAGLANSSVTHLELTEPKAQPIKIEYVPKGKIITINVSIMW